MTKSLENTAWQLSGSGKVANISIQDHLLSQGKLLGETSVLAGKTLDAITNACEGILAMNETQKESNLLLKELVAGQKLAMDRVVTGGGHASTAAAFPPVPPANPIPAGGAGHSTGVACERCLQLQLVDLSRADVTDIMGCAFAHCKHLHSLSLPHNLRIVEQEAFLKCTSLTEVSVPPTLLYIARRAFAGCTQLKQFHRTGKSKTWRGTYTRANAFLRCDNLDMPQWVHWLPRTPKDEDKWVATISTRSSDYPSKILFGMCLGKCQRLGSMQLVQ